LRDVDVDNSEEQVIVVDQELNGLARVEAELEIRNLIARTAQLADHGDLDEYILSWTSDASWEFPGAPRRGRADILGGARQRRSEGVTGPGSATRHVITTMVIHIDDATTATADSYWSFWRETATSPSLFNMGYYHDTVLYDDGAWRIARRQITLG
jgi:3-phenylpropionate/cinnamic acid dioxygenase small subunit